MLMKKEKENRCKEGKKQSIENVVIIGKKEEHRKKRSIEKRGALEKNERRIEEFMNVRG